MLGAEMMIVNLGTLASGAHIVRLNADGGSISKKVVLTR